MEVSLIDYMGDDIRVVNAARVSFAKESYYDYTGCWPNDQLSVFEKDQKLIQYLASHNHWTPFSHVQITLREKVPIFVARQRFKHMVGFTYNEVSRRYVDDAPEFFVPDAWRKRADNKKQGSSDEVIDHIPYVPDGFDTINFSKHESDGGDQYSFFLEIARQLYQFMIKEGIAPEQARMVLPQSMYTEYFVTGSLPAWARAYKLRIDPHAQKEIQDLAKMWQAVIGGIDELKHSWKALTDDEKKS